jgi:hypothetical protein
MYYGREMDMTNIIEELGDMDWFRAILYDVLGVTEQQVWTKNINKLYARYPEKFSQECANNRDLENERRVLEGNPASDNSLPEKKD